MNLYSIMLFVHVSGAIGLFIGMGIWLIGSIALSRALRVEQVRTLTDLMLMVRNVVPGSALLVIVAGLYMAVTAWGLETGWIAVAIGGLVCIGPISTWVIDPKVRAITTLARSLPDGPLPSALAERIHDPILRTGLQTLNLMLFGIVFLMTTKPMLPLALGVLVAAVLLGVASGVPAMYARRANPPEHVNPHEKDIP
jgi:hypothetical protein